MRIFVLINLILFSCTHTPSSEKALSSIHFTDRSGFNEKIASKEKLLQFSTVNFEQPQTYAKVTRCYIQEDCGQNSGVITTYHDNGQLKQSLETKERQAFGAYKQWYDSGQLELSCHLCGGLADISPQAEQSWVFDGLCTAYSQDGHVRAFYPYKKGLIHGTASLFYTHRQLKRAQAFCDNLKHGECELYYPNGKLAGKESFCEDKLLTGEYFSVTGQLLGFINKGQGKRLDLIGEDGAFQWTSYDNGVPSGLIEVYSANSSLTHAYEVLKNQKHGKERYFFTPINTEEPSLKLEIDWWEGKICGLVKSFYRNGVIESTKEMHLNKKNGLFTAWFDTKELMFIETYENDILIKGEYFKPGSPEGYSHVNQGIGWACFFNPQGILIKKTRYENGLPQ